MTREEAIMILNPETRRETMQKIHVFERIDADQAACRLAVAALRAQMEAEKNEPLTLDELREMDGDKVYIQFIGACKGFYDDEYAPYYGKYEQYVQKYNGMLRACDLPLKYYGESWFAYRHKPKEGTT